MPPAKRIPEEEWRNYKPQIQEMYLVRNMSLSAIVAALATTNFHPSKSQVAKKLNMWGCKKNVPKRLGEDFWRYAHHAITRREKDGKDTHLYLDGMLLESQKVKKETARYRGFRYGHEPSPPPPKGLSLRLKTPPPLDLPIHWSPSLPWLRFKAQLQDRLLTMSPATCTTGPQSEVVASYPLSRHLLNMAGLKIEPRFLVSPSILTSLLKSTIPEAHPGEITQQCRTILRGSGPEVIHEQLLILLFGLSNKLATGSLDWEILLSVIENSGILSTAMTIDKQSKTLLALREALFQQSFKKLYESTHRKPAMESHTPTLTRTENLIFWLLASGQDANTAVVIFSLRATPLQIAIYADLPKLVVLLLKNGADANPTCNGGGFIFSAGYPGIWSNHHPDPLCYLPPLSLAAARTKYADDLGVFNILISSGADLGQHHRVMNSLCRQGNVFTIAASHCDHSVALSLVKRLFSVTSNDHSHLRATEPLYSVPDIAIAAAFGGNLLVIQFLNDNSFLTTEPNEYGLTALHAAAFMGHVECCQQLLELGFDGLSSDSRFPSPIYLACYKNQLSVVKFLHERGSRINPIIDIDEDTLRMLATRCFHEMDFYNISGAKKALIMKMFQSHIGAVFALPLNRMFQSGTLEHHVSPLLLYLLEHGASYPLPPDTIASIAIFLGDKQLLSKILRAGANPNAVGEWVSYGVESLMSFALRDRPKWSSLADYRHLCDCPSCYDAFITKGSKMQPRPPSSDLLAILFEAGARPTYKDFVATLATGEWDIAEQLLEQESINWLGISHSNERVPSVLEATLLFGGCQLIERMMTRVSEPYSPGVLCAAVLRVCAGKFGIDFLRTIISMRPRDQPTRETLELETTAVGIAACYGNYDVLSLLLASIPVANNARQPHGASRRLKSMYFDATKERVNSILMDENLPHPFWHDSLRGSVMTYAIEAGSEMSSWLLNRGYRFDWYVVSKIAASRIRIPYLDFIRNCQIISSNEDLDHNQPDLGTALSLCIMTGNKDLFDTLIGSFMNSISEEIKHRAHDNPLNKAIETGDTEMFTCLLKAGFEPRVPESDVYREMGMTALQAASIFGRLGMAMQLLDTKPDINAKAIGRWGRTALEGAAEHGHIDMIEFLLCQGVETTGCGQRQYIRAVGFAQREGHQVAADILRNHRPWTPDDETILNEDYLLREQQASKSKDDDVLSSSGDEDTSKEDHSEEGAVAVEFQASLGSTLSQAYEVNIEETDSWLQPAWKGNPDPEKDWPQAPSAGIYEFDEPLFGVEEATMYQGFIMDS